MLAGKVCKIFLLVISDFDSLILVGIPWDMLVSAKGILLGWDRDWDGVGM